MASLPSPVQEFVEVVNAHDEEGFLATFGDSGVVADWRSTHANGLSELTFDVEDGSIRKMTIRSAH